MSDPNIAAARRLAVDAFAGLRQSIQGLDAAALNARPAGDETNSIAVLATHAMHSTRLLLSLAVGLPLPLRDRPAEFTAAAPGPEPLLGMVDAMSADCLAALDGAGTIDWAGPRHRTRADGTRIDLTAADALMHAVEHLRGHVDQASLTRHIVTRG